MATPFRVGIMVPLPAGPAEPAGPDVATLMQLDIAMNSGVRVIATPIEFSFDPANWTLILTQADQMLTNVAFRHMRWMPMLSLDKADAASAMGSEAVYQCRNNHTLTQLQPWWRDFYVWHRFAYSTFAEHMLRHPFRFMMDRILLSGSDTNDMRHPAEGPCWFSPQAVESMRQAVGDNITRAVIHGEHGIDNDMMQQVEWWYEESLHQRIREQARIGHLELDILGVRLMMQLPAVPFLSSRYAWVVGYGSGTLESDDNDTTPIFPSTVRDFSNVTHRFLATLHGAKIDIVIPGIDNDASAMDQWLDAVTLLSELDVEVWTMRRNAMHVDFDAMANIIHSLELNGFLFEPAHSDAIHPMITNLQRAGRSPYEARRWSTIHISIQAPNATNGPVPTIRGGSRPHTDPACRSNVLSCAVPIQIVIPPDISPSNIDPLIVDRLQFQFEMRWDTLIPVMVGNDTLTWDALVDCEFALESAMFFVSFSSHPADDYEVACNQRYDIDLSTKTLRPLPF